MANRVDAWIVALLFGGAMLGAWALGWRQGRRLPPDVEHDPGSKLADAALALLGLLLAFTFAMSLGRHDQRRLMVVAESNAIGDFYTCATLLDEPHRSNLRAITEGYAQEQLRLLRNYPSAAQQQSVIERSLQMHGQMTDLVSRAVAGGTPIAINLTNTLNGLTSANASRLAAYEDVLPWNTELMLLVSCVIALFLMGRQQGFAQARCHSGTFSFIALVTLVVFVVLDLNQPRRGLIRVNIECLERLVQSMAN